MSWKKQVLIICPSSSGKMNLGILLNRIWYTPVLAGTPDEGVRIAKKTTFSLVLIDSEIGDVELNRTITLFKTDPLLMALPLVILLKNEDPAMKDMLLGKGCSAILTKPLDLAISYGVLGRLSGQPRTTPRIPLKIHVEIEEGIPEKVLTSVNLSEGGIFVRTHEMLPEGTKLHIRFKLPHDTEQIELATEVVRTLPLATQLEGEPGIGLRFIDIPEYTVLKIRNFAQWEMMGDLEWESGI